MKSCPTAKLRVRKGRVICVCESCKLRRNVYAKAYYDPEIARVKRAAAAAQEGRDFVPRKNRKYDEHGNRIPREGLPRVSR